MGKRKLTINEIKNYIESKSECKLLSTEYKGSKEKLNVLCKCGNEFKINFHDFKAGKIQCNDCSKRKSNMTIEEVKLYVKNNSNCELLEEIYINVDTKMKFKCNCGEIFYTTLYKFKSRNKRQCNICSNCESWDIKRIENFINNTECELIDFYRDENYRLQLKLQCSCGDVFETELHGFIRKKDKVCNKCSEYSYYNIDMIRSFIDNNSDCELLSREYVDIYSPLLFKCNCGDVFTTSFTNFRKQNKRHCDKCGVDIRVSKQLYTYEEVKEYIESNSDCILLSTEYKGCNDKLKLRCECGEVFEVCFDKFKNQGDKNQVRCARCNNKESVPERKIEDILRRENVDYVKQYRFDDCKYKNTLPFDFYLVNYNLCIEYDGEFHYKEILGNDLKSQQLRDKIKTDYCNKNSITLIRIPYWEQNNLENITMNIINNLEEVAN